MWSNFTGSLKHLSTSQSSIIVYLVKHLIILYGSLYFKCASYLRRQCFIQICDICVESWSVSYSHVDEQKRHQVPVLTMDSFIDVCWWHVETMLTTDLKELIPPVVSGQWLSSDVMGGRYIMNEEPLWDDEGDADYSSLFPSKPRLSREISHQRDEDCITQKCKSK